MIERLKLQQLTGRVEDHLADLPCGHRLQPAAAQAFTLLQEDARDAGFELAIASSFRSYSRQLAIWNGKASGQRRVYDDDGQVVDMAALSPSARVHAILRYSALPGASRHHWGTDLDVYDAAALPTGYELQLSPAEVAAGGMFDALHCWLDQRMAAGESHGFFRPYAHDTGGVAPERWHLSYAPVSLACQGELTSAALQECWDCEEPLLLLEVIRAELPGLLARYVAVAGDWCPAQAR